MEELTIKEKASRYDEIIDVINKCETDEYGRIIGVKPTDIFPELKELEDERIRKELISLFQDCIDGVNHRYTGSDSRRWLDWLKKQGKNNMGISEAIKQKLEDNLNKALEKETPESWNKFLDEQGEQKSEVKYVYTKFRSGDVIAEIKPNGYCQPVTVKYVSEGAYSCESDDGKRFLSFPIIRQDEYELVKHKPADEAEPKFKIGDWVVSKLDGKARQISEVHFDEYNSYYVVNGKFLNIEAYDKLHHLWAIQDAKDGDVLVDVYGNIGIYKSHDDFDWTSYCSLGWNGGFQNFKVEHENENTHPATKEQRDKLEKAMLNAGYKWNKEELKLEKI